MGKWVYIVYMENLLEKIKNRIKLMFDKEVYTSIENCQYIYLDGDFDLCIDDNFNELFYEANKKLGGGFFPTFASLEYRYNWLGKKIPLSFSYWDINIKRAITIADKKGI